MLVFTLSRQYGRNQGIKLFLLILGIHMLQLHLEIIWHDISRYPGYVIKPHGTVKRNIYLQFRNVLMSSSVISYFNSRSSDFILLLCFLFFSCYVAQVSNLWSFHLSISITVITDIHYYYQPYYTLFFADKGFCVFSKSFKH